MSTEKLTGRGDGERCGREGFGECRGLRVCYTAFINVVIMIVMLLLLYRLLIGCQDDINTRTYDVFKKLVKSGRNVTGGSVQ
nr:envelope glycoprotein 24 [Mastomys natalensis cytomegalovirus 3]WEG69898.1 envelope glycoprotein 24 [Mastomys natalensis cytomegalovirus 3]WEG70038.1 envelope glycoprotein 24 [Mastomys natalensis cytomegalovirus 3]WEG70178.1 envelope glycoprotein 24 [Mastomys natalensis cytomegalovirus 3]WEG70318.1 envelope glycoprotein 24 [Mastomys natalensis cytomegalovirus 3]